MGDKLKPRIGEILLRQGAVSEDELTIGLLTQHGTGKLLGEVLVGMDYVSPQELDSALQQQGRDAFA